MELKSKKKADAFAVESEFLSNARTKVETIASVDELKEEYKKVLDEYERLLEESKFLTKVSDKLESKLNTANEQLRKFNDELSNEAEIAKTQKDKVLEKNKQLYQEKSELDFRMNRFQLTLIILIAVLVVIILILVYYFYFKDKLLPSHQ